MWGVGTLLARLIAWQMQHLGYSTYVLLDAMPVLADAIVGALSFRVLLMWFGCQPRRADYLRGGAAWLGAALLSAVVYFTLVRGLTLDWPRYMIASVGAGMVFGASGGALTLVSLRAAGAVISPRGKWASLLAWCVAFGVRVWLEGVVGSWVGRGALGLNWALSSAVLVALSWAAGAFALLSIEARARAVGRDEILA